MKTTAKSFHLLFILAALIIPASALSAEPIPSREWESNAGTKIEATATAMENGVVQLTAADGRQLAVPLDSLIDEDRKLLRDHFRPKPPQGLPYPIGEASGPHDAGSDSTFFVYIPSTLQEGRKAPLLLFTGSGGGNKRSVESLAEGAELNGWIVAASVESRNKSAPPDRVLATNHRFSKNCVEHLIATLPVDPDRLYFKGGSGGGATAFYNAAKMNAAGAIPVIGYNHEREYSRNGHYYVLTGATDFNRYTSANAANGARDRGCHRLYVGGHTYAPGWIQLEGMVWLNGRYLESNSRDRSLAAERLDWEERMIEWIGKLRESEPHRAYYWCRFLQRTYKISGQNAERVTAIANELASNPINPRYAEGIDAIKEFSKDHLTGITEIAVFHHTTPRIQSAAEALAQKYAGVPHVEEVFKELGKQTVKP